MRHQTNPFVCYFGADLVSLDLRSAPREHETSPVSNEDMVFDLISTAVSEWDGNKEISSPFDPKIGLCLGGPKVSLSIDSLSNLNMGTIGGVPVDERHCSVEKLMTSLLPRVESRRTPILYNAGFRGSGKTVLQAFNMHRFVERTQGIAIDVTFNDDQEILWPGKHKVLNICLLEVAVACRMLHRVMHYQTDRKYADRKFNYQSPIIQSIIQLKAPLQTALSLVRRVLRAPGGPKIMLAVDELSKAGDYKDNDPSLYLSISAYGCVDVQRMVTSSNRRQLLQPLSPILPFYGKSDDKISLLPFVL